MELKEKDLFWAKAKEDVIIPTKDSENGGYDIYANFDEEVMIIQPHETKMIPTNLACAFSEKYVMILKERGSTGTKGIAERCGVIDSGYRNLIFVPITNTTDKTLILAKDIYKVKESFAELDKKIEQEKPHGNFKYTSSIVVGNDEYIIYDYILYPYSKAICQAVMVEVPKLNSKEISLEELQAIPSKRGLGNLGSSGK